MLVTVYTPSSNGGVVTTKDTSPSKYFVSLLSICSPLLSKTFRTLKSISTASENVTETWVIPIGAFDACRGLVSIVNGWPSAKGNPNEITNIKKRKSFFIYSLNHS